MKYALNKNTIVAVRYCSTNSIIIYNLSCSKIHKIMKCQEIGPGKKDISWKTFLK